MKHSFSISWAAFFLIQVFTPLVKADSLIERLAGKKEKTWTFDRSRGTLGSSECDPKPVLIFRQDPRTVDISKSCKGSLFENGTSLPWNISEEDPSNTSTYKSYRLTINSHDVRVLFKDDDPGEIRIERLSKLREPQEVHFYRASLD